MPVAVTYGPDGDRGEPQVQIVVRPNQSLSWNGNKLFFWGITAVSALVVGPLTYMGFWPVLPFAGLELAVLGWALYHCARRGQWREVIVVDGDRVEVTAGRAEPAQQWSAHRLWTQVVLEPPRFRGHPARLLLRSAGRSVELGAFLTDEERVQLAGLLREVLPTPRAAS